MERQNNQTNTTTPRPKGTRKSILKQWWFWVILAIIALAIVAYVFWFNKPKEESTPQNSSSKTSTKIEENWVIDSGIFKNETTSTDTHKLADGTYRMYLMGQGGILYADSTDAKTFGTATPTGVKEDADKMISNPAVLEISANNWIMIYEQAPARAPGQQDNTPPGPSTQRNLYLATSTDGKTFTKAGVAIDSSKEKDDNYFASVPDLVKTPEGKIRMYYVSGGNAIGSAISNDNGKTWTRESGYRLSNSAVDPDVSYKEGKWVMYYSVLEPAKNALYKATSSDGLVWKNETKIFGATTGGAIVDPDVVEITPTNYVMYFGQSTSGGSTGGEQINLYRAELNKSIF